jgi:hypothetical protein
LLAGGFTPSQRKCLGFFEKKGLGFLDFLAAGREREIDAGASSRQFVNARARRERDKEREREAPIHLLERIFFFLT